MMYDYACKCGNKCERDERMSEHGDVPVLCDVCNEVMETVITGGQGTFFVGVGWYKDGYASHGLACGK